MRRERSARALFAVVPLMIGLYSSVATADFTKTITVTPGVEANAIATWDGTCDTSSGLGTYVINVSPEHGTLRFADISAPRPFCPSGSPDLPAVQALYTWTDNTLSSKSDYFQLYYELNGQVAQVDDITVDLASTSPTICRITTTTIHSVPGVLDSRRRVGVGETVLLTSNMGPVNWQIFSGGGGLANAGSDGSCPLSGADTTVSGTSACFVAPYSAGSTEIAATPEGSSSCQLTFSTVQPSGLIFQTLQSPPLPSPGYGFLNDGRTYGAEMESAIFVTPGDVSFANVAITEHGIANPFGAAQNTSPALLPVAGTYAWLVGCDYSQNQSASKSTSLVEPSYFTYSDLSGGHQTEFSQVETTLYHRVAYYSLIYSKQQTAELSPNGKWVNTPFATGSILDFPWDSPPSTLSPISKQTCMQDVAAQFAKFPAAAARKMTAQQRVTSR